jgi:AcrR family transcriptional regulator
MTDAIDLFPRRRPRQARSQATFDAVLGATAILIEKCGLDGLTTNMIADRAGVSVGSLYQFFPGKEAILATMIREMRREMLNDFRAALDVVEDGGLEATLAALTEASLQHHLRSPVLTRALEQAENVLPMDTETQALKARLFELVVGVLAKHNVSDPKVTAGDLIVIVHGLIQSAVRTGESDFEALAARLHRAVRGYVYQPTAPGAPDGRTQDASRG